MTDDTRPWWVQQGYNVHPVWGGAALVVIAAVGLGFNEAQLRQEGQASLKVLFVSAMLAPFGLWAMLSPHLLTRAPALFQSQVELNRDERLSAGQLALTLLCGLICLAGAAVFVEGYCQVRLGGSVVPSLTGLPRVTAGSPGDARR